jgi:hypothetical protein
MLAPIIYFAYNRPSHTYKTLKALEENYLAKESDIFIYCDGPKANATEETLTAIRETREIFKAKLSFKSVTIYESETNKGIFDIMTNGISKILNEHGMGIIVEDDILTYPYFLSFCNKGLDFYQNNQRVMAISGYTFPIKGKRPSSFFLRSGTGWGWATWKRSWNLFNPDAQAMLTEIENRNLISKFNFNDTYDFTGMLRAHIDGSITAWDACWYATIFLKNCVTLFPGISFTQNIGFDNSGTHHKSSDLFRKSEFNPIYSQQEFDKLISSFSNIININKEVFQKHCSYFNSLSNRSLLNVIKNKVRPYLYLKKPNV